MESKDVYTFEYYTKDNKHYMWMLLNGKRVFGGRKPTKEETKAYFDMVDKARLNVLLQDDNSKSGQAQWE